MGFTILVYAKWNLEQHFFMNRANKKEGACLYNKLLTSTRVLINSRFGVSYSNFSFLTPTFWKVSIEVW